MKKHLFGLLALTTTQALADIEYYQATVRAMDVLPKTFVARHGSKESAVNAAFERCYAAGFFNCKLVKVVKKTKKDGGWL